MNDITVTPEAQKELTEAARTEGLGLLDRATVLAQNIKDDASFTAACEFRADINKARAARLERLDPIKKKLYGAYKDYMGLMDEVLTPFDESIKLIDRPLGEYRNEQQRKADIENERLRKEAERQADDAKLQAAEHAQAAGETERAEAILDRPSIVTAPRVQEPAKVKGMAFKDAWKVDPMINMRELVKAIAAGTAPLELVMPNMPVLNQMARALKDKLNFPGVKVVRENIVASSRK